MRRNTKQFVYNLSLYKSKTYVCKVNYSSTSCLSRLLRVTWVIDWRLEESPVTSSVMKISQCAAKLIWTWWEVRKRLMHVLGRKPISNHQDCLYTKFIFFFKTYLNSTCASCLLCCTCSVCSVSGHVQAFCSMVNSTKICAIVDVQTLRLSDFPNYILHMHTHVCHKSFVMGDREWLPKLRIRLYT